MFKIKKEDYFISFCALYAVIVVMQNIFEMKTIGTSTFALMGGGTIVSWIPFLLMDVTSEVWGEQRSIRCFTLSGIINLFVVIIAQFVIFLPGTYPDQNAAFAQIFSNGPRTVISSFIAFWFGNFVNVHIMVKMKEKSKNVHSGIGFYARAVISTIFGQIIDNGLFAVLAFAPIGISLFEMRWIDILTTVCMGTCIETFIESCMVPFITLPIARKLKKVMGVE